MQDGWLTFEAMPEKLEIKVSTFANLEKYAPSDCILASDSSSFESSELIPRMSEAGKARVLNIHFMVRHPVRTTCIISASVADPWVLDAARSFDCGVDD